LFHLLFENKRFEILDAIATEYVKLFDESNGIEVAKVTTAFPMDAALEASFASIAKYQIRKSQLKTYRSFNHRRFYLKNR
jgi:F-type H+-transporting ATPase subunit delta